MKKISMTKEAPLTFQEQIISLYAAIGSVKSYHNRPFFGKSRIRPKGYSVFLCFTV